MKGYYLARILIFDYRNFQIFYIEVYFCSI